MTKKGHQIFGQKGSESPPPRENPGYAYVHSPGTLIAVNLCDTLSSVMNNVEVSGVYCVNNGIIFVSSKLKCSA